MSGRRPALVPSAPDTAIQSSACISATSARTLSICLMSTGKLVWRVKVEDHPIAKITGARRYTKAACMFRCLRKKSALRD